MKQNNKKMFKESTSVKQRYATRKLKIGMVSMLMGFTFLFGASVSDVSVRAYADDSIVNLNKTDMSGSESRENNQLEATDEVSIVFKNHLKEAFTLNHSEEEKAQKGQEYELSLTVSGENTPEVTLTREDGSIISILQGELNGNVYTYKFAPQENVVVNIDKKVVKGRRTREAGNQDYYNYVNEYASYSDVGSTTVSYGFGETSAISEKAIKIEREGEPDEEGRQKWKLIFNASGVGNGEDDYTANPRFGFTLSEDLEIVSDLEFQFFSHDRKRVSGIGRVDKNTTQSPRVLPPANDVNSYFAGSTFEGSQLQDYKVTTGAGAKVVVREKGYPNFESFRYFEDGNVLGDADYSHRIGARKVAEKILNDAYKAYTFRMDTQMGGKKNGLIVRFTTKNKDYPLKNNKMDDYLIGKLGQNYDSRVTGFYFSTDLYNGQSFRSFSRISTVGRKIDLTTDTDKDGLQDVYEKYIGSDLNIWDQDLDNKADHEDIIDKIPDRRGAKPQINGSDPRVVKPAVNNIRTLARVGDVVSGTTAPKRTVALVMYGDNGAADVIAQGISDENGKYNLEIGKQFVREGNNKYGNDIAFTNPDNLSTYKTTDIPNIREYQSYDKSKGAFNKEGYHLRLQVWSDGFNNPNVKFGIPKVSDDIRVVNNIGELYGIITPEKTTVTSATNISEEEKAEIKKKIIEELNKEDHSELRKNINNLENSIQVKNDGSAVITLNDSGHSTINLTSDSLISVVESPILERSNNDTEKGLSNNDIIIKKIAENATELKLMNKDGNTNFVTLTKQGEEWVSNDNNYTIKKLDNNSIALKPNDTAMNNLDEASYSSDGNKGIKVKETLNKSTAPNFVESSVLEYSPIRPVLYGATIKNINKDNHNIVIYNIAPNANQLTLHVGEETITLNKLNQFRWQLADSTSSQYLNIEGNQVSVHGGSITLFPKENQMANLENKSIHVVSTNTTYHGDETNAKDSNAVVYDTTVGAPIILAPAYDDTSVHVQLPEDVKANDKITVKVDGSEYSKILTEDEARQRDINISVGEPLKARQIVEAIITDTAGNTATSGQAQVADPQQSGQINEIKQSNKNTITAKVPVENSNGAKVKVVDNEGNEVYGTSSTVGSDGNVSVTIPDGLNGKQVKLVYTEPHRSSTATDFITIDQSIKPMTITKAEGGSKNVTVQFSDDVKVGDKYKITEEGSDINLITGNADFSTVESNGSHSKEVTLNSALPKDATLNAVIKDQFDNTATSKAFVVKKIEVNKEKLKKAIEEAGKLQLGDFGGEEEGTLTEYEKVLKKQLTNSISVRDSEDSDQTQIDNATNSLIAAKELLETQRKLEELLPGLKVLNQESSQIVQTSRYYNAKKEAKENFFNFK